MLLFIRLHCFQGPLTSGNNFMPRHFTSSGSPFRATFMDLKNINLAMINVFVFGTNSTSFEVEGKEN